MADVQPGPGPDAGDDEVVEGELARRPRRRPPSTRGDGGDARHRPRARHRRARRVPRRLPARRGRLRELRKQAQRRLDDRSRAPPARSSSSCCPVLDACDGALAHGADRGRADRGRAARRPREGGPRAHRPDRRGVRPQRSTRPSSTSPATAATTSSSEVMRTGYRWKGRVLRPAMVKVTATDAGRTRRPMAPQREWFEKDYYRVLGVPETATAKEITSAYRKLAREHHPDTNPGDAAAEERFKEVSAAYDVVGDAEKRKEYDEVRRLGPAGGRLPGGGGGGGPGGFPFQDVGDLGDLLGGLFGRGGARRRRRRGARARSAGQDLEAELHLAFHDAVAASPPRSTSPARRRAPRATARAPSRAPRRHRCPTCGGQGVRRRQPGPVLASPGRARSAAAAASSSTTRARPAAAPASSAGPARSRSASPPASTTASASGSRAGAARAATAGRPATSTSSCRVAPPAVRAARATTSPHRARHLPRGRPRRRHHGADPRRRRRSRSASRRARGRAARSGSRARACPPKGTGDLLVTVEVAVPSKLSSAERKARRGAQAAADGEPRPASTSGCDGDERNPADRAERST